MERRNNEADSCDGKEKGGEKKIKSTWVIAGAVKVYPKRKSKEGLKKK